MSLLGRLFEPEEKLSRPPTVAERVGAAFSRVFGVFSAVAGVTGLALLVLVGIPSWIVVPRRSRPPELANEDRVLLDPKSGLHRRYGAGSECLYLLRPDGYVGFRSQPASWKALEEHLSMLLL